MHRTKKDDNANEKTFIAGPSHAFNIVTSQRPGDTDQPKELPGTLCVGVQMSLYFDRTYNEPFLLHPNAPLYRYICF